jgi:hypothetical protein
MTPLRVPAPLPDYLAVATAVDDPARLTALTPRVMRWSEGVWLMDLSVCRSYWQTNAQRLHKQPLTLIREVLVRRLTTSEQSAHDSQADQPLRATLADHPWPALLVLDVMTERRLDGFLPLETPFAQTLYRDVVWNGWMDAARIIAEHLDAAKTVPFNAANYKRQCKQLLASVRRLRLASPWELRSAAALSVRRRFGATLAALWDWTFPESQTPEAHAAALAAFPWRRWEWTEKPHVPRVLEHALWQWDVIQPLLLEDLDKLCRARLDCRGFEGKVTELVWRLTLNDLRELPVVVRFRHPHALDREQGVHKTALLQAQYAFEAAIAAQRREDDNDIEVPIIAWSLTMEGCLSTPPLVADLFGAFDDEACEASHLLELENQLPIALTQFGLCHDWLPEASFVDDARRPPEKAATKLKESWAVRRDMAYAPEDALGEAGAAAALADTAPREIPSAMTPPAAERPGVPAPSSFWDAADAYLRAPGRSSLSLVSDPAADEVPDEHDFPWLTAARQRPLFLHPEPEPLDTCGHSSGRVFIERTSAKWWRAANDQPAYRDYYRLIDRMQRSSWIFQDGEGRWFVHGVFA